MQPLVGYLLAGVMVGPYAPGFTADPALAMELAEIGVILLIPFEAGQIVEHARAANPSLDILARAHSSATVERLDRLGANLIVLRETEIAQRMLERGRGAPPPRRRPDPG